MNSVHSIFFAATTALGAFLLFLVEPMFAKMILPRLGGAANVWITAMLFYQMMLLVGYGYAHFLGYLAPSRQWLVHVSLLVSATLFLPFAVPLNWLPPTEGNPAPQLLLMMTLVIGAPFSFLSATAPLAQRWLFSSRTQDDPYLLYSFSNAGSFAALFAYPLIIEPNFSLNAQSQFWTYGYATFWTLLLFSGFLLRGAKGFPLESTKPTSWSLAFIWVSLAAIPSSLMLSTTSFLTLDVASMPLLWIIPLALYLTTLILAFSSASDTAARWATRYYPVIILPVSFAIAPILGKSNPNPAFLLPLVLSAFFIASVLCHCKLARIKPEATQLTSFFLCIALGGVVGGVFNSLIAPFIFGDVYELPLGLALACLALPSHTFKHSVAALIFAMGACVIVATAGLIPSPASGQTLGQFLSCKALLLGGALALWPTRHHPIVMATGVCAYFTVAILGPSANGVLISERNFYGVNRVRDDSEGSLRIMEHGTTVHGMMALSPPYRLTPLGYYHPSGPLAEAVTAHDQPAARIAVVGLGAGEMACNGRPNWHFDFYEIDPSVVRIARNKSLFSFLEECASQHNIIIGDGRLQLQSATDGAYHAIVLDAFTSDTIPIHLLTREALGEYLKKLTPDGLLILHLSNRYLNLPPVIAVEAHDLGLVGAVLLHEGGFVEKTKLPIYGSLVVVLARDPSFLMPLYDRGWKKLKHAPSIKGWSDDSSHLLSAIMLPGKNWTKAWD